MKIFWIIHKVRCYWKRWYICVWNMSIILQKNVIIYNVQTDSPKLIYWVINLCLNIFHFKSLMYRPWRCATVNKMVLKCHKLSDFCMSKSRLQYSRWQQNDFFENINFYLNPLKEYFRRTYYQNKIKHLIITFSISFCFLRINFIKNMC